MRNKSISIIGVKANEENIDTVLNLGKKTNVELSTFVVIGFIILTILAVMKGWI